MDGDFLAFSNGVHEEFCRMVAEAVAQAEAERKKESAANLDTAVA